ncbi:MAG: flagellar motor protein MotB [Pseudomonadota bacterium]
MSGDTIIKKKKVINGGGHHGGAWKVAYADFVTAMMAFFLLMWLLNATTEDQRKGIADYFDPTIPISRVSAGGSGVMDGSSIFAEDKQAEDGTGGSKGVRGPTSPKADGQPTDERDVVPGSDPDELAFSTSPGGAYEEIDDKKFAADEDTAAVKAEVLEKAAEMGVGGELAEHLFMRQTNEGLVIEIIDQKDKALFAVGSARPSEKLKILISVVAEVTSAVENDIAIVGHTDATPYRTSGPYTNWELSSDRALAARRLMIEFGSTPEQIVEVAGKAASEPLSEDPYAPQNRRISVTLLRN